jgi:hypothetical protein
VKNATAKFKRNIFSGAKKRTRRTPACTLVRSVTIRASALSRKQDIERAKKIAATDGLHRSRAFERVAKLDDDDRVYAEEAIQHYLPRPLYFLTTVINRIDGLNLTPERKRALNALILVACDAGNTLWDHPADTSATETT